MNYEVLKKNTRNKSDWKLRLEAVEGLKNLDDPRAIDVLWRVMNSNKVFTVNEAAFRALQAKGQDVKLPRKAKGNLVKGTNQKIKVLKNKLPKKHSYEDFKKELKRRNPVIYDTYQGDKGNRFDKWLENIWKSS